MYLKRVADERAREGYVWDQGREAGLKEGKAEGEQLLAALMERLISDNRMEDVKLAASDEQARRSFTENMG